MAPPIWYLTLLNRHTCPTEDRKLDTHSAWMLKDALGRDPGLTLPHLSITTALGSCHPILQMCKQRLKGVQRVTKHPKLLLGSDGVAPRLPRP